MRLWGRWPTPADPPAGSSSTVQKVDRAGGDVRVAVFLELIATALLGLWLVRNWLAGIARVVAVSAETVDGATAGWVLALLVWGTLAAALLLAVRAVRGQEYNQGLPEQAGDAAESALSGRAIPPAPGTHARMAAGRAATGAWIAGGALFVAAVYHGLLFPGAITWGDWGYFVNASAVRTFFPVPSLWSFTNLGTANILGGAIAPIESAMGAMARVGVPYAILERLWFYLPAVALSYSGTVLLARRLGARAAVAAWAGVFYAANPYALALVSGGQLTVGMGYALFPWVALAGLALESRRSLPAGIALGAVLGVQAWFDPRTAGLSIACIAVALVVLAAGVRRPVPRHVPWTAILAAALVFVLAQGPWLVPALLAVPAHLPAGYTTTSALQTFSLMSLADGLTVFHPFWPTMKFIALHSVPVIWLLVPVMVGVALARAPRNQGAQVGVAVYLVFAALVSGANMPFGAINSWLFTHVPGMDLFRDPSPYFGPAALGVVVAVAAGFSPQWDAAASLTAVRPKAQGRPVTDSSRVRWRRADSRLSPVHLPQFALALGAVALVVVSAWPALSGTLGHNLDPRSVPARYLQLAHGILRGPAGTVLWVPSTSRFAPVSPAHPSVSAFNLEATTGVGFPATPPEGLAWLGVPSVLRAILQQYNIRTVVVRDDAAAYRELSLSPGTTRAAILASLDSLSGSRTTFLPGLTVFHLAPEPYPLTVFARAARTAAPVPEQRHQDELEVASFAAGLPGWQPVGDGNNYLHQTLQHAGISASVGGGGDFVRLTVRYGAATLTRPLTSCPSAGFQELELRYRTTGPASLSALIFSANQGPPIALLTFPASTRWAGVALPFVLAPTVSARARNLPLTGCALVLSVQPSQPGALASGEVRSLSLSAPAPMAPNCATTNVGPAPAWCQPTAPKKVVMMASGDRMAVTLPTSQGPQLLVFWQHYDSNWVAITPAGRRLQHVQVNGWANGFLVPGAVQDASVRIVYQPQVLVQYGYGALGVALIIVLLSGMPAIFGPSTRRRRQRRMY